MKEKPTFKTTTKNPYYIFLIIAAALLSILLIIVLCRSAVSTKYNSINSFPLIFVFSIPILLNIILGIIFSLFKYTLIITNFRVSAVSRFGSRVDLPLTKITAIGCGKLKRISVASSGGRINLFFVVDRDHAFDILSDILIKIQSGIEYTNQDLQFENDYAEDTKKSAINYEKAADKSNAQQPDQESFSDSDSLVFKKNNGSYIVAECNKSSDYINVPNIFNGSLVTSIGDFAFESCDHLKTVTIPAGIKEIGSGAFDGCTSLSSFATGKYTASIGDHAFYNCSSLSSVKISEFLTKIGEYAFDGCVNLKKIYYTGSKSQWDKISIGNFNEPLVNANIIYNYQDL